tara:strand:+ start:647 stop:985 length:339 start_codon:yes stop_codon:yes gene_type:complete
MSKDNIVKFPGIKQNKHLNKRNELNAAMNDLEEYVQYMTDMIIEQLILDGYVVDDQKMVDDLTVTINMLCGALSRVEGIPHFTHEILDAMHEQLALMMDEEDDEFDDDNDEQ